MVPPGLRFFYPPFRACLRLPSLSPSTPLLVILDSPPCHPRLPSLSSSTLVIEDPESLPFSLVTFCPALIFLRRSSTGKVSRCSTMIFAIFRAISLADSLGFMDSNLAPRLITSPRLPWIDHLHIQALEVPGISCGDRKVMGLGSSRDERVGQMQHAAKPTCLPSQHRCLL